MNLSYPSFSDQEILAARPSKNQVSEKIPYAFLNETECSADGSLAEIATIFLTNHECPFHCLMCDLWKNTTNHTLSPGMIPHQIEYALARLVPSRQVKLYNSGNFFDPKAIPREDFVRIAELTLPFEIVIVENHPLLCNQSCLDFQQLIHGQLEIALGLETIHKQVLQSLNKRMTLDDFSKAVEFLNSHSIQTRAFILLKPPFMEEQEGIEWAIRSVEYAFSLGVECCSLIPTRSGNGILEQLEQAGQFSAPQFSSIETVFEACLKLKRGRVFMDLWNLEQQYQNETNLEQRLERLKKMNLLQKIPIAE
ncbi:MAG: radical SAM protein [Planctomycetes bacterium]|nr:radical SAM protein [Planctomycetota bacterium]MCH9724504.1 radical SAM protein [Planctomycetota bacterium]MCH9777985.1 radical SAM protein [Planctomycetota bacterium]MCH9791757.1 radical SAM protein [Planctomycetota bacterium]